MLYLYLVSGGVGAVVNISASQSWGPRFDSRPGRGLNIWVTFFPAKVHSAFHPPGVGKMSIPAYVDRLEAAARGAYICFWSAGGKLIIAKRLWACYMEKALYKCTTLLYFFFLLLCCIFGYFTLERLPTFLGREFWERLSDTAFDKKVVRFDFCSLWTAIIRELFHLKLCPACF